MANGADISLNDGLATPVARTFKIVRATPELSVWKDKRLAKPAYWPELSLAADVPATTAKIRNVDLRFRKPVVDAVSGLVTDTGMLRLTGNIPVSMSQAEVDDLYAFFVNALANALIKGAVKDMDVLIG
jgi:hypothetical protein